MERATVRGKQKLEGAGGDVDILKSNNESGISVHQNSALKQT